MPEPNLPAYITVGSQRIPVNWTRLKRYKAKGGGLTIDPELTRISGKMENKVRLTPDEEKWVSDFYSSEKTKEREAASKQKDYEVWMPVLPPNMVMPGGLWGMSQYLYRTPAGQRQFEQMDDTGIEEADIDMSTLPKVAAYMSWRTGLERTNPGLLNAQGIDDFLARQSELVAGGQEVDFAKMTR